MFAIVEIKGRNYKVQEGDVLKIDFLRKASEGEELTIDRVLLVEKDGKVEVGTPYLDGVKVKAKVLKPEVKAKKVRVFWYIPKKNKRRTIGHRQRYTEIRIDKILGVN